MLVPLILGLAALAAADPIPPLNDGRIVGGNHVTIEQFPYQVSLSVDKKFFCGGAIVSNKVVITAAHCLEPMSQHYDRLLVRAGSNSSAVGGSEHKVVQAYSSPDHNNGKKLFDVGVLIVDPPFEFNSVRQPIPLPKPNFSRPKDGSLVTISGFGRLTSNGPIDKYLRAVTIPVIPWEHCQKVYSAFGIDLAHDSFCAGFKTGRRDSCQGDSGGPLVQDGKLVGIVSYGIGCAEPEIPGVYENVVEILPYIKKYIHDNL